MPLLFQLKFEIHLPADIVCFYVCIYSFELDLCE